MSKFKNMPFYEGGCGSLASIVAKKSLYKSKEAFFNWCLNECDELETEFEGELNDLDVNNVSEGYVRYYPKMPEGFEIESGWTFCNKGKGAVEVYVLGID